MVESNKLILYSKSFGICKRFKILPSYWVEIRKELKLKNEQWCLGYKILQFGCVAYYYHSPIG